MLHTCFPSRPSGVLSRLKCDSAEAYVSRFNTWLTPAFVASFLSPQFPVAKEYFSPSVMNFGEYKKERIKDKQEKREGRGDQMKIAHN